MHIVKLGIVGLGLIGTSVALAARRAWPGIEIAEVNRGDKLGTLEGAEFIVLATPVAVILELLRSDVSAFRSAVVMDAGSTKRAIMAAARERGLPNFVGGHPMAGGSTLGAAAARADLFDRVNWFLLGQGDALRRSREFVAGLGALPVVLEDDGSEHDRILAAVSHLPQVVASALMRRIGEAVGRQGLGWAGGGLRDTTRLAESPASMWESILASNASEIRPLLVQLADDLREIAGQLEDPEAVRRLFSAANEWKRVAKAQST